MLKKVNRQKKVRHRKNFLATLIVTLFLWTSLGFLVYFTDPAETGVLIMFFILLFLALFFTTSILFENTRRGAILTSILTAIMLLRLWGVGNIINILLLVAIFVTIEFYFSKNQS